MGTIFFIFKVNTIVTIMYTVPKQKGIFLSINGQNCINFNFLGNFTELLSENVDTIIRTIETDVEAVLTCTHNLCFEQK